MQVATLVAILAVSSIVAPPIALVFASAKAAAVHCLSHAHHEFASQAKAVRADNAPGDEDHAKHSHGDHKSGCCCLFSVTVLMPNSGHLSAPGIASSPAYWAPAASLQGLMRHRLDRPPISLRF